MISAILGLKRKIFCFLNSFKSENNSFLNHFVIIGLQLILRKGLCSYTKLLELKNTYCFVFVQR